MLCVCVGFFPAHRVVKVRGNESHAELCGQARQDVEQCRGVRPTREPHYNATGTEPVDAPECFDSLHYFGHGNRVLPYGPVYSRFVSERAVVQGGGLEIAEVARGSAAERAGLRAGDVLEAANGTPLQDVIQLRFETAEPEFVLRVRRGETTFNVTVCREFGEDLGIEFRFELGDKIHTCNNKCVFCFIHQMPKRMRRSLYLMDDDYRLSFLHGNYVTLTNLKEDEFERICREGLSPMYVSVHATDPVLRGGMLGRKEPAPVLDQLATLAENGIDSHAQVVLCPGWNDGAALDRTVHELATLHPRVSGRSAGVLSVALVPVGLTKHRERLTKLTPVDAEYAAELLKQAEGLRAEMLSRIGTAFVFPSDEWFFYAGKPYPPRKWYEDFPQYEDGIGTCRKFIDEARAALRRARPPERPISASILTSPLPASVIRDFAEAASRIEGISLNVCVVENHFFGPLINVAGLMTGADMIERMAQPDVRDTVFVPSVCVNAEGLLLDDIPAAELSRRSDKQVTVVEPSPTVLLAHIGALTRG